MSHFCLIVVGNEVEKELAPFDENLKVEPWIRYHFKNAGVMRREGIEWYKNILAEGDPYYNPEGCQKALDRYLAMTDEEYFAYFTEGQGKRDEEGNVLSTMNPKAKFDYFQIGGAYKNYLPLKVGSMVNVALKREVDWEKIDDFLPFAFLRKGEWVGRGNTMLAFGYSPDKMERETWKKKFLEIMQGVDEGETLTVVDCHI